MSRAVTVTSTVSPVGVTSAACVVSPAPPAPTPLPPVNATPTVVTSASTASAAVVCMPRRRESAAGGVRVGVVGEVVVPMEPAPAAPSVPPAPTGVPSLRVTSMVPALRDFSTAICAFAARTTSGR